MLNKTEITKLKQENPKRLVETLKRSTSDSELLYMLNNLGRLPDQFDGDCFIPLLQNGRSQIRYAAVKNLGKLADGKSVPAFEVAI